MIVLDKDRDIIRETFVSLMGNGRILAELVTDQYGQPPIASDDIRQIECSQENTCNQLQEEPDRGTEMADIYHYRIGTACMLCPSPMVKSAAEIADVEKSIRRIILPIGIKTVYSVRGTRNAATEYIVIGSRFCTCHYFRENVLRRRFAWACKHIIAVLLRISVKGASSIGEHPDGYKLLLNIFGTLCVY
jgi:predicted nucleic acid-binding Zn finger protein